MPNTMKFPLLMLLVLPILAVPYLLAAQGTPNVYTTFGAGANGSAISASSLNASTPCNASNGSWSAENNTAVISYSTSAGEPLLGSITCGGLTYQVNGSGTQGITYKLADGGSYGQAIFNYTTTTGKSSAGMWMKIGTEAASGDYDAMFQINANGAEAADTMIHGSLIYLEEYSNPNGPPDSCTGTPGCTMNGDGTGFLYGANTWYWITIHYVAGGESELRVYDISGNMLCAMTKATTNNAPTRVIVGREGDQGGAGLLYEDDLLIDTTGALYPILPGVGSGTVPPTNLQITRVQ